MGKTLVLAEKPSVARELARVLGCKQKGDGLHLLFQYGPKTETRLLNLTKLFGGGKLPRWQPLRAAVKMEAS